MAEDSNLYSTTEGEENINYRDKDFRTNPPDGDPVIPPINFSTVIGRRRKQPAVIPGKSSFVLPEEDWDRYAEGFGGSSYDALQKYREDTQSTTNKVFNTIVGGIASGLGTALEDLGYMMDLDTYASMLGQIDHDPERELGVMDIFKPNELLATLFQKSGRGIKSLTEDYLPVYENIGDGIVDQVFSYQSAKGVIDSALGFVLAGYGAGTAVKGLSKVAMSGLGSFERMMKLKKLPSIISKLDSEAVKTSRIELWNDMMMQTNQRYQNVANFLGTSTTAVMTKGAEARMEGLSAFEESMELQKEAIQSGAISYDEAKYRANQSGNHAFNMTMATVALDALMLKDLFKGPIQIKDRVMKPGFKSWAIGASKTAAGAPKEGFEEMWQEAAQLEGAYGVYEGIKDRLSKDQQLNYIKKAGFDPNNIGKSFLDRTIAFLGSDRAKVAGLIGAISGPLQAKGVEMFSNYSLKKETGKTNKERLDEAYKAQQSIFDNNEKLFGKTFDFATTVKKATLTEELKKVAALADDDVLHELASEQQLLGIAEENFENGTIDQLEETIKNNPSSESTKVDSMLKDMKSDYVKAKGYINSDQVFSTIRSKKLYEKLANHFDSKSKDSSLTEEQRTNYAKSANVAREFALNYEQHLSEITNKNAQLGLVQEQKDRETKLGIYSQLPKIKSITQLQNLKNLYPNDKEYITALNQQIDIIQKGTSAANKVIPKQQTVSKPTDLPKQDLAKDGMYEYNGLKHKIKSVNKNDKGEVTSIDVDTYDSKGNVKSGKIENKIGDSNKFLSKFKMVTTDEIVTNKHGLQKESVANQPVLAEQVINSVFNKFNENKSIKVEGNIEEDIKQIVNTYNEVFDNAKTISDISEKLVSKATELYNSYVGTNDVILPTETGLTEEQTIVGQALLDALEEQESVTPEDALQDFNPSIKKARALQERRTALMWDFIQVMDKQGIDVYTDFSKLISTLSKIDVDRTKANYKLLRTLYLEFIRQDVTGNKKTELEQSIPLTYDELFGKKDFQPTDENNEDILTPEELREIEEWDNKRNTIAVDSNEVQLLGIYSKSTEALDKKNELPASSIAYQSQEWDWHIVNSLEKLIVEKQTKQGATVRPDVILNPNKRNEGEEIDLIIDTEYEGPIKLSTGEIVQWSEIKKAIANNTWNEFQVKHKLDSKEEALDYLPIKILSKEKEVLGYVHTTAWINELNAVGDGETIENFKEISRSFRKKVYDKLIENGNQPITTTITERVIGINKNGQFQGGVLNTGKRQNTAESLPDGNLKIGMRIAGAFEVKGNRSIQDNIVNINHLGNFKSNVSYVLVPLGKKGGRMQYWAHPLLPQKLPTNLANTLVEIIKIYAAKEGDVINEELYQAYLQEGIDLKITEQISPLLKSMLYLFRGDRASMSNFIQSRTNKVSVVSFEGGVITFGRSDSKNIIGLSRANGFSDRDIKLIKEILSNATFNVNRNLLNKEEMFTFVEVDNNGQTNKFVGDYNTFVKQNTTTLAKSTELLDGSYSYTIQQIVRFDLNPESLNKQEQTKVKQEIQKEPIVETSTLKDIEKRRQEELNQLEKELNDLGIVVGENNLKEAAEKILEDIQSPFIRQVLKALLNLISKTGTKLTITKGNVNGMGVSYDHVTNTIQINLDTILNGFNRNSKLRASGGRDGLIFRTFDAGKGKATPISYLATQLLHETIHAFTTRQINSFEKNSKNELTKEEYDIIQKIQNIINYIKSNKILQAEYGISDIHELLAELFSNETFADKLKNIAVPKELQYKAKSKNLFEGIIDLISDLITKGLKGFTKQSINNEETAFQNISNLVNDLINAKYDAELAALEKQPDEVILATERDSIEKRREIYYTPLIELAEEATKEKRIDALPFNKERFENKVKSLEEAIKTRNLNDIQHDLMDLVAIVNESLGNKNRNDSIELEETISLLGKSILNKFTNAEIAKAVIAYKESQIRRSDTAFGFPVRKSSSRAYKTQLVDSVGDDNWILSEANERGILTKDYYNNDAELKALETKVVESTESERDKLLKSKEVEKYYQQLSSLEGYKNVTKEGIVDMILEGENMEEFVFIATDSINKDIESKTCNE